MNRSTGSRTNDVVLRDGSTVQVRPVQPGDEASLQDLLQQLSRESLYYRFFTIPSSTLAEVSGLMAADGTITVTLVGELAGRLCAVASYVRSETDRQRAEVAFAIADAVQGRGLGTRMLEMLAEIGRETGLQTFDAYVLGDNQRMLRVFFDTGFEAASRFDSGVFHVTLSLASTAAFELKAAERAEISATASMKAFFEPQSVVVVGANRERGKIGSEVLHNLVATGFTGRLSVVNPSAPSIGGIVAHPSVRAVPGQVDLAIVCVPAAQVAAVVDDCVAKGVKAVVVI